MDLPSSYFGKCTHQQHQPIVDDMIEDRIAACTKQAPSATCLVLTFAAKSSETTMKLGAANFQTSLGPELPQHNINHMLT
eukprot:3535543-Rhodomonas_salina.1